MSSYEHRLNLNDWCEHKSLIIINHRCYPGGHFYPSIRWKVALAYAHRELRFTCGENAALQNAATQNISRIRPWSPMIAATFSRPVAFIDQLATIVISSRRGQRGVVE